MANRSDKLAVTINGPHEVERFLMPADVIRCVTPWYYDAVEVRRSHLVIRPVGFTRIAEFAGVGMACHGSNRNGFCARLDQAIQRNPDFHFLIHVVYQDGDALPFQFHADIVAVRIVPGIETGKVEAVSNGTETPPMPNSRNTTTALAVATAAGAYLLTRAAMRRNRDYDFRGKTVLITGGSRGLGLVLAREFAGHGARLVICARDSDELDIARAELSSRGTEVLAVPCDLADRQQVHNLVDAAIRHFGSIDVLVNNAGTIGVTPIEHATMEDYHYAMDTNFWGAVHTAYYLVPHMQQRRSGRIVNISSIGGKIGVPHLAPYCASKFALNGWSRSLRGELMKDGIVVTTVIPGLMRTGSPRNADFKGQNVAEYAWFKISDSLPVLSVSAEHAAKSIVAAARRGDVELIIGTSAKLAVTFDQNLPEISGELAALAGRMLPSPGGIGIESRKGAESESKVTQSPLTGLTDQAAWQNNEVLR